MSFIISSANNEVQRLTEGTDRFLRRREDGVGEVGAVCLQFVPPVNMSLLTMYPLFILLKSYWAA